MSQHDEERAMERLSERPTNHGNEARAGDVMKALLDDPRLRQALGYLEDCGADEIWLPLQRWIEDRDHVLRQVR